MTLENQLIHFGKKLNERLIMRNEKEKWTGIVGHAVLFYEYDGKWYKTQFESSINQIMIGVIQSVVLVAKIRRMLVRGLLTPAMASYLLSFCGCTIATITNVELTRSELDDAMANYKLNKTPFVKLKGDYSYVYSIANRFANSKTNGLHFYSLFYNNCAHYIEYLLSRSKDFFVRQAINGQKTPIKLYYDLQHRHLIAVARILF